MDEYAMTWSDAARIRTEFTDEEIPCFSNDLHDFGTLGRALWRERTLRRILSLDPGVRREQAHKIVEDLAAASQPVFCVADSRLVEAAGTGE